MKDFLVLFSALAGAGILILFILGIAYLIWDYVTFEERKKRRVLNLMSDMSKRRI